MSTRAGIFDRLVLCSRKSCYFCYYSNPDLFLYPFFRKLNVTSAYEYLEARFGASLRVVGSLLFILFHIGRVAIVVYLPTLAITSVSDINPIMVASIIGVLCIIYTFLGGMEGVIWSDVIQGIILLGGAILVIVVGINYINGGFSTIVTDALENDKLITAENFQFGTAAAAIPIIFLGSIFNNLHQYTASRGCSTALSNNELYQRNE